ncbi:hypothetical protein LPJ77_000335 [Coemansia sp. RSA 2523]|nr:hypothetical protein LPJ54_000095 [Coemansia sp. RSA 1824]KAJ1811165.1 hypothetical protein LPJ77_000335 [Coemansia sp. RSA 2523]KAJ2251268.1 hypothetical protein GGH97_000068 [Coemansia sp. RSA 475]KAJ2258394.1 hypothetical protein GGH98_000195 [Coemansia sp. RSA 454]KAJ2430126.1 hypothetical protein GGF47_000203 [Coemansia sp. RSA 2524]
MSDQTYFTNKEEALEFCSDLSRWRLNVDNGRQTWEYMDENAAKERPQSFVEKYWLGLAVDMPELPHATRPQQAADNGWEFFKRLQTEDGHWAGAYDGPLFVTCGIVVMQYITGVPVPETSKREMTRYLLNMANDDGGWGLHTEGKSTVFGTAMNYVMLRILGMQADHPVMTKARNTLHKLGSARAIASWGKFWLCALGVYEWEGMNPLLPEPLLIPSILPLNPGNWWVHTRAVFVGMSYTYGLRRTMPLTELTKSLRAELYDEPYEHIDWPAQRDNVSVADRYVPNTLVLRAFNTALGVYERWKLPFVRTWALREALFQIENEVRNTHHLCIAPVNFATNMLAIYYAHGADSDLFRGMRGRLPDVLWMCYEGLAACGTNGSQLWDTAFAVQAAVDAGLAGRKENRTSMLKALEFLESTQIRKNPENMRRTYRQATLGAWPFSTRDQAYTVSDTTAEALRATLMLQQASFLPNLIADERLYQAVDLLLGMQNWGGGFASYERVRGPQLMEYLNASEVFGNIMVEYSYPECTTSAVLGLSAFHKLYPLYKPRQVKRCIDSAIKYVLGAQRKDGSWYGSWGVCFTYASMFALQSLACVDMYFDNCWEGMKACAFLIDRQNEDGGWGEAFASCEEKKYVPHPDGSQVVHTAWAVLALMAARCTYDNAITRGIVFLMKRQQPNGEWLQESIEGVFNHSCGIRYPNFKFIFPVWALGKYAEVYGNLPLVE